MELPKVSYGDKKAEDVDWRDKLGRKGEDSNDGDDEEDLSLEEKQELIEMLGFDPDELEEGKTSKKGKKKKLQEPPRQSFT